MSERNDRPDLDVFAWDLWGAIKDSKRGPLDSEHYSKLIKDAMLKATADTNSALEKALKERDANARELTLTRRKLTKCERAFVRLLASSFASADYLASTMGKTKFVKSIASHVPSKHSKVTHDKAD